MSGTKKIKTPVAYQRVQWKTKNTSRGIKHQQIRLFAQNTQSLPSTPSRPLTPPQEYEFNGDLPEPLHLPHSTVRLLYIILTRFLYWLKVPVPTWLFGTVPQKAKGVPILPSATWMSSTWQSVPVLWCEAMLLAVPRLLWGDWPMQCLLSGSTSVVTISSGRTLDRVPLRTGMVTPGWSRDPPGS